MNITAVRNSVSSAIANAPTTVTIVRDISTSDGYDGETIETVTVAQDLAIFLDTYSSKRSPDTRRDSGKTSHTYDAVAYILCSDDYVIKLEDRFTVGDTVYRVNNPKNTFEVVWICELEVVT